MKTTRTVLIAAALIPLAAWIPGAAAETIEACVPVEPVGSGMICGSTTFDGCQVHDGSNDKVGVECRVAEHNRVESRPSG